MRYQEINALSNGDCLKLIEDYEFKTDFKNFNLKKGTRMVIVSSSLNGYDFKLDCSIPPFGNILTIGKKRLHLMKLKN